MKTPNSLEDLVEIAATFGVYFEISIQFGKYYGKLGKYCADIQILSILH